VGSITTGNTVSFTTLPKVTSFSAVTIDISTVNLTWDGSFAAVNVFYNISAGIYYSSTNGYYGTYNGNCSFSNTTKKITINGLITSYRYYFQVIPTGTYGALGYGLMDFSMIPIASFGTAILSGVVFT
jgi:hypothetical protein